MATNKFQAPEDFETEVLNKINDKIGYKCEMSISDRLFLNGLIRQVKPKKILEVGVAAGGSAAIILNAIKDIEDAKLYSVDFFKNYYQDPSKFSGYLVNEICPELSDKWTLYTEGFVANHLDKIGKDIDFCLIDTIHVNPGEILDFLMVLPYLKKNAVVVFHDTSLFAYYDINCITNCLLLSAIPGEKIVPSNHDGYKYFPNIGAVILDDKIKEKIWGIFNLLTLPWRYLLSLQDYAVVLEHFERFYDKKFIKMFLDAKCFNEERVNNQNLSSPNETELLEIHPIKANDSECTRKNVLNFFKYILLSKITHGEKRIKYNMKRKKLKAKIINK